jgi:outer membrane receptor protein involved in Fe transport
MFRRQSTGEREWDKAQAVAAGWQTDDSTLQAVVDSKAVEDLPLNGRNFVQLAQVVPGANEGPSHGAASGGGGADFRPSSLLVVNGQADLQNNHMIDGTDNNERLLGLRGVRTSIGAISEVNVMTGQYTAELGRTAGGVVNVITKSGTDQFHGTLYELRVYGEQKQNHAGQSFWARGYFVSTVGRDEATIRDYIRDQEQEDKRMDQLNMWK